ncbi:sarcosine oxidase [Xylariaceae sp. FL0016]|nr:sarcosine oxidase [Xylariaceae sp. FL0016]
MAPSDKPASYLIVGAGVFGTSAALHLKTAHPSASVTLVDRDAYDAATRVAASWDWNKVVRADYRDLLYCRLALEAQDVWRADPLWAPFYHESGIYWISRSDFAETVRENFAKLGRVEEGKLIEVVRVEEARKMYRGLFEESDYTGIENVLVNKGSGWADAKGALRRVIERAVELGVTYVTAEVEALQFEGGACVGVKASDGGVYKADHTILSTGSFTPKLLDTTAEKTGNDKFRAGERIISAGVTTGLATLDEETAKRFEIMPVNIQENDPERGASNGTLPLNSDKQLKWWGQHIFKNTQKMSSGNRISAPPPHADYAEWEVPGTLKEDVEFAKDVTFGKFGKDWNIHTHRICWEALTPSEDFIISPHSASQGLYIATCGSFHGWKFFPIIGDYIMKMVEGKLEDDLVKRWAWDRELPDGTKLRVWPKDELKDL